MKLLLVSDVVLWNENTKAPYPGIVEALDKLRAQGHSVFLVSGGAQPTWLSRFPGVQFQACDRTERMNGNIVRKLLEANVGTLRICDVVILGAKEVDFIMAANSQSLLIRCEWAVGLEPRILAYGLPLGTPEKLADFVALLQDASPWYYQAPKANPEIFCLTNAGTMYETDADILRLNASLKNCLKYGAVRGRDYFSAHLLSSVYATDIFRTVDFWGWYPSSKANSSDTEIMKHFSELARTTFGIRRKDPLFVRHKDAVKRHSSSVSRTDPASQVTTIHLNPKYKKLLAGKTVAVLDDFLTYGLSFGVAKALLKKAGADKVLCLAMGKFGNQAREYKIDLQTDAIFEPITKFADRGNTSSVGNTSGAAQKAFVEKLKLFI